MDIKYSSAEGTIYLGSETEPESGVDEKFQNDPLAIGEESFENNRVKSNSMEIDVAAYTAGLSIQCIEVTI